MLNNLVRSYISRSTSLKSYLSSTNKLLNDLLAKTVTRRQPFHFFAYTFLTLYFHSST